MNSLSWFIYLTQIFDSLQMMGGILIGVGLFSIILLGAAYAAFTSTFDDIPFNIGKSFKWTLIILGIGAVLAIFSPSQRTMLLILSSEAGQKIIQSGQTKGMIDPSVELLKNWIIKENKQILKELKKYD